MWSRFDSRREVKQSDHCYNSNRCKFVVFGVIVMILVLWCVAVTVVVILKDVVL